MITATTLKEQILEHARTLPEGTPLVAKEFLHLGNRAAVDQALSRMASSGALLRAARGLYVLPVNGRYGMRAPSSESVVEKLAELRGETYARHGASAANVLGLTTQVPLRPIYLTSGPSWELNVGGQPVELRHVPKWQLVGAASQAGVVIRALAWLGPEKAGEALQQLRARLSAGAVNELIAVRPQLPAWLAQAVSVLAV